MSARVVSRRPRLRGPTGLLHWAEVPSPTRQVQLSANVVPVLRDLVSWAADIALVLTHHYPEEQSAIERVRRNALAWLDGETTLDLSIEDVLSTAAILMAAVDKNIGGTVQADDRTSRDEQVFS